VTAVAIARPAAQALARWRPLVAWWAISRLVALLAFLVLEALGRRGPHLAASLYSKPLALLGSWDGVWYGRIAQHGYLLIPGTQSNPAFFPLFPILLRGLKDAFGLPYTAGGALVANLSLLVALPAFYELSRRVLRDDVLARRAACFMAVTPMGFVFSMSYPESLAVALSCLALLSAFRDRWLLAAALAASAVLARPEAMILVIPLAATAWAHRSTLDPVARGRALAAILAAPAAVATYPLYLQWSLHDAGAWGQAQTHWGRAFDIAGPWRALRNLPRNIDAQPVLGRDAVFLVLYAALLLIAARRGVSRAWIISGVLVLALPLFSGSLESEARFGLLALPVYWGASSLVRSRRGELALQVGSLVFMVAGVMALPYLWP
jgi:hypothetical protein